MRVVQAIKGLWSSAPDLDKLVRANCLEFDLDPKLVACIIYQESLGEPEAYRFEDEFYNRYLRNKERRDLVGYVPNFPPTLASEKRARSASWGVMQVMGETARWMGFKERFLPKLARSEFNVKIGCKYLRHLFDKAKTSFGDNLDAQTNWVLTKWNGSSSYPPLIREHLRLKRWREIINGD